MHTDAKTNESTERLGASATHTEEAGKIPAERRAFRHPCPTLCTTDYWKSVSRVGLLMMMLLAAFLLTPNIAGAHPANPASQMPIQTHHITTQYSRDADAIDAPPASPLVPAGDADSVEAPSEDGNGEVSPTPQPGVASKAQDNATGVVLSDDELVFHGVSNDALQRTFTLKVTDAAIHDVTLAVTDLVHRNQGVVILSDKITLNPAQVETVDNIQRFAVTINGADVRAGTYDGELSLWYKEVTATIPISLPVTAIFESAPTVGTDPNGQNQILSVWTQFWPPPYIGRTSAGNANTDNSASFFAPIADFSCTIGQVSAFIGIQSWFPPFIMANCKDDGEQVLGEMSINLIQRGEDPALVEDAQVLNMVGSGGAHLPADAVHVVDSFPVTIPGQSAVPVDIAVAGRGLPAGEFTGNLLITVRNQVPAFEAPLKVQIKHHYAWALIVLGLSMLIGVGVAWYNNKGLPKLALIRQVDRAEKRWQANPEQMQVKERTTAREMLDRIWRSVQADDKADDVTARLTEFNTFCEEQQKAVAQLLESLDSLRTAIGTIKFSGHTSAELTDRLDEIRGNVESGIFRSLSAVQEAVDDVTSKLQRYLDDSIDRVITSAQAIKVGVGVRDRIVAELGEIKATIMATTDFSQIPEWVGKVESLRRETDQLVSLQDQLASCSSDVCTKINQANNLQELLGLMNAELVIRVDKLHEKTAKIKVGTKLRDQYLSDLDGIKRGLVSDTDIAALQKAEKLISDIQPSCDQLSDAQESLNVVPEQTKGAVNDAKTLDQIIKILEDVKRTPVADSGAADNAGAAAEDLEQTGGSYVKDNGIVSALAQPGHDTQPKASQMVPSTETLADGEQASEIQLGSFDRKHDDLVTDRRWMALRIRAGNILVQLAALIFALIVGWAILYWANPTFGAQPEDYITLFLWGAAVNVFGGRTIDLKSIYQPVAVGEGGPGPAETVENEGPPKE